MTEIFPIGTPQFTYYLYLDDERYPDYNPLDNDRWRIARNFDDAVWYVRTYGMPMYISFDHDLGAPQNRTGMDFAKWLVDYMLDNDIPVDLLAFRVHSQNPIGAENIRMYLNNFIANNG
jgi:hypothetical protein